MFIQLGREQGPDVKETVYYAKAGISTQRRDSRAKPVVDPQQMELAVLQSEINFHAAQAELNRTINTAKPLLVNQVAVAVALSLPQLSVKQMQHAMFVKQLFHAGEIDFSAYIAKMRNLFPDRMANLSARLLSEIEKEMVG